MKNLRFTHKIVVPNTKETVDNTDGYFEELSDVKVFTLSQEEFDDLRKDGGLFDAVDEAFGTIIDDCEEDRIESIQVPQAISIVEEFFEKGDSAVASGLQTVHQSLKYAEERGVFWEIINGAELYE